MIYTSANEIASAGLHFTHIHYYILLKINDLAGAGLQPVTTAHFINAGNQ
jgi:hypothetical protein